MAKDREEDFFERYFKIPIMLIDGDEEDKHEDLGISSDGTEGFLRAEVEIPDYAIPICMMDIWQPFPDSKERAANGEFDAVQVRFTEIGDYRIPWTKAKFKKVYNKWFNNLPQEEESIPQFSLSGEQAEQFLKMIKDGKPDNDGKTADSVPTEEITP